MLVGNGRPKFMNEQYFFVRKFGLGKEVVSLTGRLHVPIV